MENPQAKVGPFEQLGRMAAEQAALKKKLLEVLVKSLIVMVQERATP